MLKHYFLLQKTRLDRQITGLGIQKHLGYLIAIFGFIGFSFLIFSRAKYPEYLYLALALSATGTFSDEKRNTFLKSCYSKANFQKLRLIENVIIVLPFFFFLISQKKYLVGLELFAVATILSFVSLQNRFNVTLPTPFYKYPYEFTEGARNTWLLFLFLYAIVGVAIAVHNFNLGLVSIAFASLFCGSFYLKPEPYFYVWIHAANAKTFIFKIIKTAILYTTIACLPMTALLSFFYFDKISMILGCQFLGYLFVLLGLLGKYAAYPSEMSVKQAFAAVGSIWFPPLLLITIPAFYFQSIKRLKPILGR